MILGFIDAGNPEVRRYEIALMVEMITKYPVDGVSIDYMRGPNRVGYTDSGREAMKREHGVDLAELVAGPQAALETEGGKKAVAEKAAAGAARKHPVWPKYQAWQRAQINGFMREIRQAVDKARPGLQISTYCWGAHTYTGTFETYQDWKTWIAEGWLDWINP